MDAKNFLMSHLSIQQVRVLLLETRFPKDLNLFIALCVPLFSLQEIRVSNESFVEVWVQNSVDCMVEQSVSNGSLVNIPRLRVRDVEGVVAAVGVGFGFEV